MRRRRRVQSVCVAADKLPFSYLDRMYFSLHQTLARAEGQEKKKTCCRAIFCSIIYGGKTHREASPRRWFYLCGAENEEACETRTTSGRKLGGHWMSWVVVEVRRSAWTVQKKIKSHDIQSNSQINLTFFVASWVERASLKALRYVRDQFSQFLLNWIELN